MSYIWIIILTILLLLILSSLLLFIFPLLLHSKKQPLHVKRCAHRGGAGEGIENTMAAFHNAVKHNADLLEIDVQITMDGEIVISHDNDIQRVTGQPGKISETLYSDLPRLRNNLQLQFEQTVTCNSDQTDFSFVKLRDMFQMFPDIIINLDTKEGDEALLRGVSDLVNEFNRYDKTIWGNMREVIVAKSHKVNPKIMMFMSIKKVACLVIAFYLGLLSFVPLRETIFEIPMPSILVDNFYLTGWEKFAALTAHFLLMNRLLFWHLNRRGIKVVVWVLNHEEQFRLAMKYNIDGIMTDFPRRLDQFYKEEEEEEKVDETCGIVQ